MNIGKGAGNSLWINPVVPVDLGKKVKLFNRMMIPITTSTMPIGDSYVTETALGNITYQALFANAKPIGKHWIVAIGPAVSLKTNTFNETKVYGDDYFGVGITPAIVYRSKGFIAVANYTQTWSVAGDDTSTATALYMLSYSFKSGTSILTSPMLTYDSSFEGDTKWVVPVGLGVGQILPLSKSVFLNLSVAAYYNALKPVTMESEFQFQVNMNFTFAMKKKR